MPLLPCSEAGFECNACGHSLKFKEVSDIAVQNITPVSSVPLRLEVHSTILHAFDVAPNFTLHEPLAELP